MEATDDERGIRSVVRRLRKENVALAVLEATGVRPEPRPLADEHARELSAVVLRRRQILAMTTAEANTGRARPRRP
jgi:hypothetical protein